MKNKILVFILSLGLLFGSLSVPVRADENVITIQSLEEFRAFAQACALDSWSEGKTVRLEADIDIANRNDIVTVPYFRGIFDGQGHTVRGLTILYDGSVQGLFRYIDEGGVVKNLNVVGTVTPDGSMSTIGGIAGENRGQIINCNYTGVVKGSSVIGGIVGNNGETGLVKSCRTSGIVHGDHYVGGIAGKNSGSIENCANKSNINTSTEELTLNLEYINLENLRSTENTTDITDIGGIAGYSMGKVESCINQGTIGYQHVGYNVGGIVGRQSGYVNNCTNYGAVYGRKDIGGINGQMEPYHTLIFSETTLTKLDEQLDALQAAIDKLNADAEGYSDAVTGRLSDMQAQVNQAQSSVDTMLNEIQHVFNADTDTINELSERVSDTIDKLVPVSDDLTKASERLKASMKDLQKAAADMEEVSDVSQEAMEFVEMALEEMEDAQADFDTTATPLSEAEKKFGEAFDAFSEAVRLLEENASADEIENKLREAEDALTAAMEHMQVAGDGIEAGMEDVSDALSALSEAASRLRDTDEPLKSVLKNTQDSLNQLYRMSGSAKEALAGLQRALEDLAEKEGLSFTRLEGEFDASQEQLADAVRELTDILDFVNSTVSNKNKLLVDDIQAVSDELFAITDTLRDAFSEPEEEKDYVEDVSYEDTDEQIEGKAAFCTNLGNVEGDVNVGGIAGSMAIEYDFDPEDDVKTEGDTSSNFIYQTRAVIRSCTNRAEITAKKNCAGGIVGSMDLGSVIDSYAYGSISSTGGKYTGGVAGFSRADIRNSYAKCTLSGNDYVGGIAGEGNNILNCRSLVKIEESGEYTGAVAGACEGTLEQNYFVSETLAGVDGISYHAKAEPMTYQDFIALENIPLEFKSFQLVFRTEEENVYEQEFAYGADLSGLELPKLPKKEGSFAKWEETDYSHLVFDTTVHAVYDNYITALESSQKRNELPVLVVEGSFDETARLSFEAQEPDVSGITGKNQVLECWKVQIPEDGNAIHRIQYLLPESDREIEVECRMAGGWVKMDAKKDGQYLVFEADGTELVLRSVALYSYKLLAVAAGGAVLLLALAGAWLAKRRAAKKKGQKEEKKEVG